MLRESDVYLFAEGTNYYSYKMLGVHKCGDEFEFAVWAENAAAVFLTGDFCNWDKNGILMEKYENSGIWYIKTGIMSEGSLYKYYIEDKNGHGVYKADPFAFVCEETPGTASVVSDMPGFDWEDGTWMKKRKKTNIFEQPMSIYEVHLESWQRGEDGSLLSYREIAHRLCLYVLEMNFTHIELMPLTQYPYAGSWGYQVSGYFAITRRFGEASDFMYFVNHMHENGIGVIMDWVPAHFPRDEHGLRLFDGTPQFEYADPRLGEHKEWGTLVFDYSKPKVRSFLISSAMFLLEEFHLDGLRVDAVSSMIYRDYGRRGKPWLRNKHGGNENEEATAFLRQLCTAVLQRHPNVIMAAEESTSFPLVTAPPFDGGLGFNYKWNMGFMHDILKYMSTDPLFRCGCHNLLTFSMVYAFSENFILPFSHDEVVHGKKSLLSKMPGSYEEKFANLRAMLGFVFAHPGKKLLFMGGEFGQFNEWNFESQLDWMLFDFEMHNKLRLYVSELCRLYRKESALYRIENSWDGFRWINPSDNERSVISFLRSGKRKGERIIIICNFTPVFRRDYTVGVPTEGEYEEILSSAEEIYGGDEKKRSYKSINEPCDGYLQSINVQLAGLSTVYLKKKSEKRKD